ncbi:hypothetical protein N7494_011204 [Penicillium frequentans]|uniref:Uncharacterized protein n=1 Tax=Penicillium frequentans TaxID=3151616 RepID=A0AAD6GAG7_9EURO|nr:hypothetical protein N7494_011204 [Penicillium glabrum]
MVESYGAIKAFDYHSASCGMAIRAFTKDLLCCYGRSRGKYVALEPPATRITARKDVQTDWVMALTIFGKPVDLKGPFGRDAVPGDYQWASEWYELTGKLVEEGLLRPHPTSVQPGGWEGIMEGIEQLRCGQVRGKKFVYAVGE